MALSRSMSAEMKEAKKGLNPYTGKPRPGCEAEARPMWRRVMVQAARDAASQNAKTRAEIFRWTHTADFTGVCQMAGVDPVKAKDSLRVLIASVENYPRAMVLRVLEELEGYMAGQ